jgi:hypothetical protein
MSNQDGKIYPVEPKFSMYQNVAFTYVEISYVGSINRGIIREGRGDIVSIFYSDDAFQEVAYVVRIWVAGEKKLHILNEDDLTAVH